MASDLKKEKVNVVNIPVKEQTRINVKYFDKKDHFEINGPKTKIIHENIIELKKKLQKWADNCRLKCSKHALWQERGPNYLPHWNALKIIVNT